MTPLMEWTLAMTLSIAAGLALIVLVPLHLLRWGRHDPDVFSPPAAWSRAAIYACCCLLLGAATGALDALLNDPLVDPGQLSDPLWLASTGLITVFIVWAYWIYWYRNTLRFGRRVEFLPQLLFGLAWGFCTGLLFLCYWHIAAMLVGDWGRWAVWLVAYIMISVWQALWMDMFWDVWVSPEHDSPDSIRAKVPRTHIPNMTLCLAWFAVYENYWIFVGWQTIALLAASFGMRMPSPWSREPTPPARREPGLFGLPRAGGYVGDNTE